MKIIALMPVKNEEWILESALHMKTNYRKNSRIKSFDSIIKFINEQ